MYFRNGNYLLSCSLFTGYMLVLIILACDSSIVVFLLSLLNVTRLTILASELKLLFFYFCRFYYLGTQTFSLLLNFH